MTQKEKIQSLREQSTTTLTRVRDFIHKHDGDLDDEMRRILIKETRKAFETFFACAYAEGLPSSTITAQRCAEHYIMGCNDKRHINS